MRHSQRTSPAVAALLLALGADARVGLDQSILEHETPVPRKIKPLYMIPLCLQKLNLQTQKPQCLEKYGLSHGFSETCCFAQLCQ